MENSVFYYIGLIAGILCGILLVMLFGWIIGKAGGKVGGIGQKEKKNYDERQLLVRGKAYKGAFIFLAIYVNVAAMLDAFSGNRILLSGGGILLGTLLALFLFASICVMKDAYMGLKENAKGIIMMLGAAGALNLIIGISQVMDKDSSFVVSTVTTTLHEADKVKETMTLSVDINLLVGIICGALLIEFLIKQKLDQKED